MSTINPTACRHRTYKCTKTGQHDSMGRKLYVAKDGTMKIRKKCKKCGKIVFKKVDLEGGGCFGDFCNTKVAPISDQDMEDKLNAILFDILVLQMKREKIMDEINEFPPNRKDVILYAFLEKEQTNSSLNKTFWQRFQNEDTELDRIKTKSIAYVSYNLLYGVLYEEEIETIVIEAQISNLPDVPTQTPSHPQIIASASVIDFIESLNLSREEKDQYILELQKTIQRNIRRTRSKRRARRIRRISQYYNSILLKYKDMVKYLKAMKEQFLKYRERKNYSYYNSIISLNTEILKLQQVVNRDMTRININESN